jgi:DNA-binding NarL/FixJ family response regulator
MKDLSDSGRAHEVKEAINLGAMTYLPKPFEREQILRAVRGVLVKV